VDQLQFHDEYILGLNEDMVVLLAETPDQKHARVGTHLPDKPENRFFSAEWLAAS